MLKHYLIMALLSILPISELRGAIPYGYLNGIPLYQCFIISVLVNAMAPLLGYFFFSTLHKVLDKWQTYHRFFERTIARSRAKVGPQVEKYGLIGLAIFVGVPLPMTGAWTGTIGSWVLGLDKKKSALSIQAGVLIAGIVVTLVVYTGAGIGSLFTTKVAL